MPRTANLAWADDVGEHVLTLHGLGREAFERLMVDHPPTHADGKVAWDDDFCAALVAGTSGLPAEVVAEMREEWTDGDWRTVAQAALGVSDGATGHWGSLADRLEWDERFREELAYCVPLGIPHSVFLAWPPDDQDKALAYLRHRAEYCSCGTRTRDWKNLDGSPNYFSFVATSETCLGCEAIEIQQDNIADNLPKEHRRGVKTWLIPNPEGAEG